MRKTIIIIIIVAVLGTLLWYLFRGEKSFPGEFYASAGTDHISLVASLPRAYTSNPPSSGGHFGSQANWGVYDYEVSDRLFIHNLEHGGVWIAYKPGIPSEVVASLKSIIDSYGGSKWIMAPRSQNDADVAVVAWQYVYKFDLNDSRLTDEKISGIRSFYEARKDKGPERVPDSIRGIDPKSVQK